MVLDIRIPSSRQRFNIIDNGEDNVDSPENWSVKYLKSGKDMNEMCWVS